MYITGISNSDYIRNKSFCGTTKPLEKFLTPENIEGQIKKIAANKDTKDIFKGLSVLAASLAAELAIFTEKDENARNFVSGILQELNTDENKELKNKFEILFDKHAVAEELPDVDFKKLKEEKPEREVYLKMTSYFPNLYEQYKKLLTAHVHEPENDKNNFVLSSMENLFGMFTTSNERLMRMRPYIKVLNDKYSNCLDGIAENLSSTIANGNGPMYYLVLLHNEKISEEDIQRWAKNKNLSCDEFMLMRCLDDNALNNINQLKEVNPDFRIKKFREMDDYNTDKQTYAFMLEFQNNHPSLSGMLKTVADVHKAIYGDIHLKEDKEYNSDYLVKDIQSELVDNILKDRRMDATYNFVKFINPSVLKDFNYTSDEIKFLAKDKEDYKKIKEICSHSLMNLDFENPKLLKLAEIINDEKIFGKIFTTRHSKIRFVTRFVLKDNYNPVNLKEDTLAKINTLFDELRDNAEHCNYFAYVHPKGTAPQFYIRKSKLGNFVKITLNGNGSIHTIYEDFNKELKTRNSETQIEN